MTQWFGTVARLDRLALSEPNERLQDGCKFRRSLVLAAAFPAHPAALVRTQQSRFCFSPEEDCAAFAVRAIDNAEREILVGAYGLTTGSGTVEALVRAKQRGVDVQLIADKTTPCPATSGIASRPPRDEIAAAAARAAGAEAMIAHMKLVIAKLRREQYGQSSERGRKVLDQLELQLEELAAETGENAVTAEGKTAGTVVKSFTRGRPVRAPLPAHLPRERVVIPRPCPVCGGRLAKLGEDITETLEIVPRQWKVIQTVREKFSCRSCEKITQPPAPFHAIARARAGASLLAMILYAKFGQHQPLNRQSDVYGKFSVLIARWR